MQTNVDTLVAFHVHRHVLHRMQWLSISGLEILRVGPHHVVGFAGGYPLSELAAVVGIEFPSCPFVLGAADLDLYPEDWMIVRSPDCAKDQRIRLVRFYLLLSGGDGTARAEGGKEQQGKGQTCGTQRAPSSTSSHRLRFPLPLPLLRTLLPPL